MTTRSALVSAVLAAQVLVSTVPATAARLPGAQVRERVETIKFGRLKRKLQTRDLRTATTVALPSLSLDAEELDKILGVRFYEERNLFEVMSAARGKRVVFVSSTPIDPVIVDYYLNLMPDPAAARRNLVMLSANDAADRPLTEKVLAQKHLRRAIQKEAGRHAVILPFVTSALEKKLSTQVKIPVLGPDPKLAWLGSKSGSRKIFAAAGVPFPDGANDLWSDTAVLDQLVELSMRQGGARKLGVKLNDGFSGKGNATLDARAIPGFAQMDRAARRRALAAALPHMEFAHGVDWKVFARRIGELGAVVEEWVDDVVESPSAQALIHPDGRVELLSTHEQILDGQIYLGAKFPARADYRLEMQAMAEKVGAELAKRGARGRFAVDFVASRQGGAWSLSALEINLRQGGTTHPYEITRRVTGARYDAATGNLVARGKAKFYVATDNAVHAELVGYSPRELIAAARRAGVAFARRDGTGAVFHLMGALTDFGKVGFTAIGDSPEEAQQIYDRTIAMIAGEARRRAH